MVKYSSSDLINIEDFVFAWRITDARWDKLPTEVLERICPLSTQYSTTICELSTAFQMPETRQVSGDYRISQWTSLEENGHTDRERIKNWLIHLPIQQTECVYVFWKGNVTIVVEWNLFVQIWDSLWYPFDNVYVFDETLDWAAMFGPEERAIYVDRILCP